MSTLRPKYITFDCYGTLTRFRMADMAREMFADRVPADRMAEFILHFAAYRLDEVLDPWKPYKEVVMNAVERTCKKWGIPYIEAEGQAFYDA
ncbi:haloacid dehalogenase type II, partial [Massilia cavernae]